MKVLISDNISPQGIEILKRVPEIEVDIKTKLSNEELKEIIKDYDGLIIRSGTKVTAEIIDAATNLKVIGRAGIGVDNVDIGEATKKGIVVMNTPGGNNITTAEHAISLLLSLTRNIPQATTSLKSGKWEKGKFIGCEICNKTLGVIGIGNIGSIVADRALGLKMNVIAYDPYISQESASKIGVELVSLDELFKRSHFITIHVPITEETRHLIDREAFNKMRDRVMIINCARGGIIDEEALYEAIVSGKVAGAALDVFEKEPPGDNPLLKLNNVICTPHLGASTDEAQINVAIAVAEQVVDYLVNGIIKNAVNVPSVSGEILKVLKPYIDLAEKLGSFQVQISKGGLEEISVEYSGEVSKYNVAPITLSLLKGLLSPILGEGVNYVNAPIIAKERGIRVIESKRSEVEDFASLITTKVRTKNEENIIAGAIFGKRDPRIVRIDDFFLEAIPEGYILVIHNIDKPGVIGNIGTTLGKNSINIAGFQLGREKIGGKAISLLHVDSSVPKKVIEEIKKLPNIISVIQVKL
jgi:D-3-phosphoglycerate dehydrogenase